MKITVLDIGGTSIKSASWEDGVLQDLKETPTDALKGGAFVMEKAREIIRSYGPCDRIGISTAGQVDSVQGMIRYANQNIPGYTGMRIKELMETEFQVPTAVENDVNAAALGEAFYGAGRGEKDFLCLTYGTGVGGAIVMDQRIYTGAHFSAGEFGGIITHPEERDVEKDVFSGCYEKYASTTGLVKKAMEYDPSLKDGRAVFSRIDEKEIQLIVEAWVDEIVYGLTTLIHIFNPSCVVLGGGVMGQKYILERVEQKVYQSIVPSFRDVVIKQAQLGNTAGLLGAAQLALEMGRD